MLCGGEEIIENMVQWVSNAACTYAQCGVGLYKFITKTLDQFGGFLVEAQGKGFRYFVGVGYHLMDFHSIPVAYVVTF